MAERRESQGLVAVNLRVKVTRDPRNTQSGWLVIPGQIGFKRKDGSYHNEWVDVWSAPGSPATAMGIAKGDIIYVWGRMAMDEEEYNGQMRRKNSIWADQVEIGQQTRQPQERQQPRQASGGRGRQAQQQEEDQGPAFPSEASGLDDVPFALILAPLAALAMTAMQSGWLA